VPLTHLLEPMFFEEHPAGFEPVKRVTEVSPMRFSFKDILSSLEAQSTIDLPAPSMPTITLKVHRWDKGYANRPFRETVNTVYVVMRGSGRSVIGDSAFEWQFGDTIAAPAWSRIEHHASEDSIVFSMSDEALMRWTRYYRHEDVA